MALVCALLSVFFFLVIGQIILSWFPPGGEVLESARRALGLATNWALDPLRRTIPPVRLGAAALDLSPLVLLIGIRVIQAFIC